MTLNDYVKKIEGMDDFYTSVVDYISNNPEWKGASMFEDLSFEGIAFNEAAQELYMPQLVLTKTMKVKELTCQCSPRKLCIHRAGLILAANLMIKMECYDWSTALQKHCEQSTDHLQAPPSLC